MRLLALHVQDFRNLGQVSLSPSPHATIAVGQNGQGKTNLLEALYFLATLKPLRAGRLSELVRWGTSAARVSGRFLLKGAEREISVEVSGGVRQSFVDGKKASSLEDYFGGVSVVAFTPDDLEVVKDVAPWAVSLRDRGVGTERHFGEDGRYDGHVVRDLVEHRAVRAVVHGVENDLELDGSCRWDHGLNDEGNKLHVGDIMDGVDEAEVGQLSVRVVGDRGGDVCAERMISNQCKPERSAEKDVLGLSAGGTVSNMSMSMFAWMAQFDDVSLRAVTRME